MRYGLFLIWMVAAGSVFGALSWHPEHGVAFQSALADDDGDGGDSDGGDSDGGDSDGGDSDGGDSDGGDSDGGDDNDHETDRSSDDDVEGSESDSDQRSSTDRGGDDAGQREEGTYVPRVTGYREAFNPDHLERATSLRASAPRDLGHLQGRYEYAVLDSDTDEVETSIEAALEAQGFEAVSGTDVLSVIREAMTVE